MRRRSPLAASDLQALGASGIANPIFFIPPTYDTGGLGARTVAIEDFNRDGHADLAITNHCFDSNCATGSVGILLGNGDGTYQAPVSYNAGGYFTQAVTAGDFNGDGKGDLALANQCSDIGCTNGSVTILLGNGDGTFGAAVSYGPGGDATFVAAGDLNGDGKLDLAVANYEVNNVGVLLGRGDGTFLPVVTYASGGDSASSVALADFNGDGRLDLAVTNYVSGSIAVLLGNGNGTFQPAVSYPAGGALASMVVVADFNHDNRPDLAVADVCNDIMNCVNGAVGVLLGNGDGTFKNAVSYLSAGQNSYSLAVADFNGDGKSDLAVSNESASATLLLGAGNGTFQVATSYESGGSFSFFVASGDVNGDGHADLIVSNDCLIDQDCAGSSVIALLGRGDGSFQSPTSFASRGATALAGATADFNGDGKPDLVLACVSPACTGSTVDVLLSRANGTFQSAASYSSGGHAPASVGVGDFNGDGRPDLVVSNSCITASDCTHGRLGVLKGNANGTFQAAVTYPIPGNSPGAIAVGDFNRDGKLDLAVVSQPNCCFDGSDGAVNILLGNGSGGFGAAVSYSSGDPFALAVAVADFDGDGKLDLAVANGNCSLNVLVLCTTGSVGVLRGNGDGTFRAAVRYSSIDAYAFSVVAGDFNGDGKLDLAVGNNNCEGFGACVNGSVAVLLGNGNGTFQAGTTYPVGDSWPGFASLGPNAIAAGDLDGDGKLDLVASNRNVLLGNGDGSFQAAQSYQSSGAVGFSELLADFNGDGQPDLLVADSVFVTELLNLTTSFAHATSTAVISSRNPARWHQRVTFTAAVISSSQSHGVPTGTITFSDHGRALDSVPVNPHGKANFSTTTLDAGVHVITASYSGDHSFQPSTSPALIQTVRAETRIKLTSSHNPSHRGQPVTFTAVIRANSGATPTGTVTFREFSRLLATVALSGGEARFTISFQRRGPHLIRADYSGDSIDQRSFAMLGQRVR